MNLYALTMLPEKELPKTLHGDQGRLRQVIINLLQNSLKHVDHGAVSIAATFNKLSEEL